MAAKSDGSSGSETPSGAPVHKYDHLIGEQVVLMRNAQESLKQSLGILEKASSQEEHDSAMLQVSFVLARSEELLVKLKVVVYIKKELEEVFEQLREKRRKHERTDKLIARQQWLEGRLDNMLLGRRRGRPGARGLRATIPQDRARLPQDWSNERGRQAAVRRDNRTVNRAHDDTLPPIHHRASTIGSPSELTSLADTMFSSKKHSIREDMTDLSERTSIDYSSYAPSRHTGIAKSVIERDSDEWHSDESEANWTTIDTPSKHNNDVMKEDNSESTVDKDPQKLERMESESNQLDSSTSINLFEPPRSSQVFHPGSWNRLCLAHHVNFIPEKSRAEIEIPNEVLHNPTVDSSLIDVWEEIKRLQDSIHTASKVFMSPGMVLPTSLKRTTSVPGSKGGKRVAMSAAIRRTSVPPIIPLELNISQEQIILPMSDLPKQSRRIISKNDKLFPKNSKEWCYSLITPKIEPTKSKIQLYHVPSSCDPIRHSQQSNFKKSCIIDTPGNSFRIDLSDFKEEQIKRLVNNIRSTKCIDQKLDAIQAIGELATKEHYSLVIETLNEAMVTDKNPEIQYSCVKSLIKQRGWSQQLYFIVSTLLSGQVELQQDILNSLSTSITNEFMADILEPGQQLLLNSLQKLTSSANDFQVSLQAAMILVNTGNVSDTCIKILKCVLNEGTPMQKVKALESLINIPCFVDADVIASAFIFCFEMRDWRHRLSAVNCLLNTEPHRLGDKQLLQNYITRRIANEPVQVVKVALGSLATKNGLRSKLEQEAFKKLESVAEMVRAEGITILAAFVSDSKRIQNALIDIVELDPSMHVRLLAVSMLGRSNSLGSVAKSRIRSKSEGSGPLARHCKSVIENISSH